MPFILMRSSWWYSFMATTVHETCHAILQGLNLMISHAKSNEEVMDWMLFSCWILWKTNGLKKILMPKLMNPIQKIMPANSLMPSCGGICWCASISYRTHERICWMRLLMGQDSFDQPQLPLPYPCFFMVSYALPCPLMLSCFIPFHVSQCNQWYNYIPLMLSCCIIKAKKLMITHPLHDASLWNRCLILSLMAYPFCRAERLWKMQNYTYNYILYIFKTIYIYIIISKSYFLQLISYLLLAMGWKKLIIPPPHPTCAPCFWWSHGSRSWMPVHATSDSSDGASKSEPHWKPTLIDWNKP